MKRLIQNLRMEAGRGTKYRLLLITSIMLAVMTAFESLKQFLFPAITVWESHIITIIFSTSVAAAVGYDVIRKMQKLNEELELKVEERTKQLREAQEELVRSEKLSMLGLIAGGMGNELRNPLGVMNNAVFYLKSIMQDADERVGEYFDIIKQEIDNSQGIISSLLDFYTMKTPQTKAVPAHELISQGLRKCAIPENIRVYADTAKTSPVLYTDPTHMVCVLQNLINNAVQAMPDGEPCGSTHVLQGQVSYLPMVFCLSAHGKETRKRRPCTILSKSPLPTPGKA